MLNYATDKCSTEFHKPNHWDIWWQITVLIIQLVRIPPRHFFLSFAQSCYSNVGNSTSLTLKKYCRPSGIVSFVGYVCVVLFPSHSWRQCPLPWRHLGVKGYQVPGNKAVWATAHDKKMLNTRSTVLMFLEVSNSFVLCRTIASCVHRIQLVSVDNVISSGYSELQFCDVICII